jgi:hypothetical protein
VSLETKRSWCSCLFRTDTSFCVFFRSCMCVIKLQRSIYGFLYGCFNAWRSERRRGGGSTRRSGTELALFARFRSLFLQHGENEPCQAISRYSPRTNETAQFFLRGFRFARETAEVVHPSPIYLKLRLRVPFLDFNSWLAVSTKSLLKTALL